MSLAWFYKWAQRPAGGPHTPTEERRADLDVVVEKAFTDARGLHGSPRLHADLREAGWVVSEKTVADSMRRQGLVARRIKRRNGLTRQDKTAPKYPDLLRRDFTAKASNTRWVGDMTEIPTMAGKLYVATVIDLFEHIRGVIFHTDRGSTYTANDFTKLCRRLKITQSMGRVGSCFDNAAAEAFFSSLEWEVLSRHDFTSTGHAQAVVIDWCYGFYNHQRRQRRRRAVTDQLRERRPHPRSGIRNPPRSRGTTDRPSVHNGSLSPGRALVAR